MLLRTFGRRGATAAACGVLGGLAWSWSLQSHASLQDKGQGPQDRLQRHAPQRRPSSGWDELQEGERPIFVGIAGGTGSGKTTVATAISARLGGADLAHICHDSYYRPLDGQPMEVRAKTNFDHPDSLETSLLVKHLTDLKAGKAVRVPRYDFTTHSRLDSTDLVEPSRIILVEGILIYAHDELRDLLDIKIFVDTDSDVRFIRRLERDIKSRGREPDSVISQYLETVRPMHNQFVEPSKRYADVIIPTGLNSVALEMVVARLQRLVGSSSDRAVERPQAQ